MSTLLFIIMVLSLCACSRNHNSNKKDESDFLIIDTNSALHDQLLCEAENNLKAARYSTDMGLVLQGEYFYGQAQASVSSLRYAIDIILWLMGEGDSLADVTDGAPYRDWDDIVASGMCSPMPYYFEGLTLEIQGKTEDANACYQYALSNPTYEERDFWYLRNMSVKELYELREKVIALELEIFEEYTPHTKLCTLTRTGIEYSPTYHLTLAAQASFDGNNQLAWNCALNALLTNPTMPELYSSAISYGLCAKATETLDIINEGLSSFPDDEALNAIAEAIAMSAGNTNDAKTFQTKSMSVQDNYYLTSLYPKAPKLSTSYPARLIVTSQNAQVTLNGTCGMDASLSKEDMLDILNQALDAVPEYKNLDAVIKEKETVENLTNKLHITDEDADEVFRNLLTIIGLEDIKGKLNPISVPSFEELNGNVFHDYETIDGFTSFGDNIKDIAEILLGKGDLLEFLKPDMLPTINSVLYNGAKVTWEEFKKDQEKYKDIVTISQAKARLRQYYNKIDSLTRDLQSKKGAWAIRILDQQIIETVYNPIYGDQLVPCSFTADIELVKESGDYTSIEGTYSGKFVLKEYTDLSDYDSKRHITYADYLNKAAKNGSNIIKSISGHSTKDLPFIPVSIRINSPSQSYFTLQGNDVSVQLALPQGTNRTFFELPLDATVLEQTEYVNTCDYVSIIKQENHIIKGTYTTTEIYETNSFYRNDHLLIKELVAPFEQLESNDDDSGSLPADIRPYIKMELVVDMLN